MKAAKIAGIPEGSSFDMEPLAEPVRYGSWAEFFRHVQELAERKGTSPQNELNPIPNYMFREFGPMPNAPWQLG